LLRATLYVLMKPTAWQDLRDLNQYMSGVITRK
jgi:hypothetical protein